MITTWWQCLIPVHGFPAGWLWAMWALLPLQVVTFGVFLYLMGGRRFGPSRH